jgi:hypothetical protein
LLSLHERSLSLRALLLSLLELLSSLHAVFTDYRSSRRNTWGYRRKSKPASMAA